MHIVYTKKYSKMSKCIAQNRWRCVDVLSETIVIRQCISKNEFSWALVAPTNKTNGTQHNERRSLSR